MMYFLMEIGDYIDFYVGYYYVYVVGVMFCGLENVFQLNYMYLLVGYYGRVLSIVVDGMLIWRLVGQILLDLKVELK